MMAYDVLLDVTLDAKYVFKASAVFKSAAQAPPADRPHFSPGKTGAFWWKLLGEHMASELVCLGQTHARLNWKQGLLK